MEAEERTAFYAAIENGEQHPLVMVATLAMALWCEEQRKSGDPQVGAESFTPTGETK